jgi:hypothetical protein
MGTVEGVNVYVLSYAPSYERCSVGGFDWYPTSDALMKGLSDWIGVEPREFVARDYRIMTLQFPEGTSMEEIAEFMDTAEALNVVDPPDPSSEVTKAFEAWRLSRKTREWVLIVKRTEVSYHEEIVRAPADWDARQVAEKGAARFWDDGGFGNGPDEVEDEEWAEPRTADKTGVTDNGVTL